MFDEREIPRQRRRPTTNLSPSQSTYALSQASAQLALFLCVVVVFWFRLPVWISEGDMHTFAQVSAALAALALALPPLIGDRDCNGTLQRSLLAICATFLVACSTALVAIVSASVEAEIAGYVDVVLLIGVLVAVCAASSAFLLPLAVTSLRSRAPSREDCRAVWAVSCSSLPLLACVVLARPIQLVFICAFAYGILLLAALLVSLTLTRASGRSHSMEQLKVRIHDIVERECHRALTEDEILLELNALNETNERLPVTLPVTREALHEMVHELNEKGTALDMRRGKYFPRWSPAHTKLVRLAVPAIVVFGAGTSVQAVADAADKLLPGGISQRAGLSAELLEARDARSLLVEELERYEAFDEMSLCSFEERNAMSSLNLRFRALVSIEQTRELFEDARLRTKSGDRIVAISGLIVKLHESVWNGLPSSMREQALACLLQKVVYREEELFAKHFERSSSAPNRESVLEALEAAEGGATLTSLVEKLISEDDVISAISATPRLQRAAITILEAATSRILRELEDQGVVRSEGETQQDGGTALERLARQVVEPKWFRVDD